VKKLTLGMLLTLASLLTITHFTSCKKDKETRWPWFDYIPDTLLTNTFKFKVVKYEGAIYNSDSGRYYNQNLPSDTTLGEVKIKKDSTYEVSEKVADILNIDRTGKWSPYYMDEKRNILTLTFNSRYIVINRYYEQSEYFNEHVSCITDQFSRKDGINVQVEFHLIPKK
jgi:hypothetical protein